MNSLKQAFWKKCTAIGLAVAVIFSGINPVMFAQAETTTDGGETINLTVKVAPSTVNAIFYEGEDGKNVLSEDKIVDKGVIDGYHQYELQVEKGRYSYRGVDTLGTEDSADDLDLGGMAFDAPLNIEVMEDGSMSEEGQVLYLRSTNFYTKNTSITAVGDYTVDLYPAGLPTAVNGRSYVGTIGSDTTEYVITPVLLMARGNALTYQGKITLAGTLGQTHGVAPMVNKTFVKGTGVLNQSFSVEELRNHTITAPAEAKVQVFNQMNNFNVEELQQAGEIDNQNGTVTHTYKAIGTTLSYRVSMQDKITRAGYFGTTSETVVVTYNTEENPSVTGHVVENIQNRVEASTMVNVNSRNSLNLSVDDTFRLRAFRGAWQIINADADNIMIEPDFHYTVISGGEHIKMTPVADQCTGNAGSGDASNWMDIQGVSEGTAIIEVSYDAIEIGGKGTAYDGLYGATDPQRKSLVVINVGGSDVDLQMKAEDADVSWDAEYDTLYFIEDTGTLQFTATLNGVEPDKVELSTDKGNSWKMVNPTDGVYRAEGLIGGNNLLRFSKGNAEAYQVVRAAKVSYTLENASRDDEEIIEGDEVQISFQGLYLPVAKFAGIYNPGYGNGHKVTYTTPETVTATASGGQYDFINSNVYTVSTTTAGTVKLTGGHIVFNIMGTDDPSGGHRLLTDSGVGTNFSAVSTQHARAVLPDITFDVISTPMTAVTITADAAGTDITVTDEAGKVMTAENGIYALPYGTYKYVAEKEGYVTERDTFTVEKVDFLQGSKTINLHMRKVDGSIWDGVTLTEPKLVDDVYQVGTGAELAWFAANAGGTSYNAVLTADISLGGFPWTPIAPVAEDKAWTGTFDGSGYYVTDLYIDSTGDNMALFGYVGDGALIQNLGICGEVTTTGKYAAGIVTVKDKDAAFVVENCKSEVRVTGNVNVGGIIANQSKNVAIRNCYNTGAIKETQSSNVLAAGGVSCATSSSTKVVIENCYNTGRIIGVGKHGTVVYLSGKNSIVNVKNSYGLVGTCKAAAFAAPHVTHDELQNLASTLGSAYMDNPTSYNSGYPILTWEAPTVFPIAQAELPAAMDTYKNVADYRQEEQKALTEIVNKVKAEISAAKNLAEINAAVNAAKAEMDQLKTDAELTAAELEAAKAQARAEIESYKNAGDYREAEQKQLESIIQDAIAAIEMESSIDGIKRIVNQAKGAMDALEPDAALAAAELKKAQEHAYIVMGNYNLSMYRSAEQSKLTSILETTREAIEKADNAAVVNRLLQDAATEIATLKTDAEYTAEENAAAELEAEKKAKKLAAAKKTAKEELTSYKNAADYRSAEQTALAEILQDAVSDIDGAKDVTSVQQMVKTAKNAMDQLKTEAEYDAEEKAAELEAEKKAEELAAAKKTAKEELTSYKNAADYRSAEQTALAEILQDAVSDIDGAKDVASVQQMVKTAKKAMNQLKTKVAYAAEENAAKLTSAKKTAKEELTAYKNAADYRSAEQTALAKILQDAVSDVDGAKDVTSVQQTVTAAKKAMDQLKTKAAYIAEENAAKLAAAKKTAKEELASYKNMADYRTEEQNTLAEILQDVTPDIDGAKDVASVQQIVTTAKNAMDLVKTDAQLKAEEQSSGGTTNTPADKPEDKPVVEPEDKPVDKEPIVEKQKLKAPTTLKAANVAASGKIKLTWKKVKGADQYKVYRATTKKGKYKLMKTVKGTSYINMNAKAGKAYYYKVKAVSKNKKITASAYSKIVKATCDLHRPVVTAKNKAKKQVKLTWKKVPGAKKYTVYRATSKNGKYKKIATTTKLTYTNKKLKKGKVYYYKVKAIAKNTAANSAFSTVDKCKVKR